MNLKKYVRPTFMGVGVCPRQDLLAMIDNDIISVQKFEEDNLQPSSLDLTLGDWVKCVRASFLPGDTPIAKELESKDNTWYSFDLPEDDTRVLKKGETYIIPLRESLNLPAGFTGYFNAKSSTGRADLLTRVLVDGVPNFDFANPGKHKLYIEITPLSWNVRIKQGLPVSQLRINFGESLCDEAALRITYHKTPLLFDYDKKPIPEDKVVFRNNGIQLTADVQSDIVAHKAKPSTQMELDLTASRGSLAHRVNEFWEPIEKPKSGELVVEPNNFYVLSTRERTSFPHLYCGTLEAYDPACGESKIHYAGFADIGFGFGEAGELLGTPLTSEYRGQHMPFRIRNGQPIGLMRYHKASAVPVDREGRVAVYGVGIYKKSNYQLQRQGHNLGKQFLPKVA